MKDQSIFVNIDVNNQCLEGSPIVYLILELF